MSADHVSFTGGEVLLDTLRRVRTAAPDAKGAGATAHRARLGEALSAVTVYLDGFREFHDEKLLDPLWSLLLALGDLEKGKQADFLKPDRPTKGGAPPMSLARQTVMGMSAVAMDMLINFDGLSPRDASNKVAKVLTSAGFKLPSRGKRQALPDVVADWRSRVNTGPGGAPEMAVKQWEIYQDLVGAGPERVDTVGWLQEMRAFVAGMTF